MKRLLEHLETLVGLDSRNPPRNIGPNFFDPIIATLGPQFRCEVTDHGGGSVTLLATRGTPRRLFNVHLDTVPAAAGYTADPHALRVTDERAIGLGACDIKGAAAGLLAAAEVTGGAAGFLFTTDEEAGSSTCVRKFCVQDHRVDEIVVAEPTLCRAVVEHRGIQTATALFSGTPGHASSGRADEESAVHHAIEWAHGAKRHAAQWPGGLRFNLGRIEGGEKPNMIADQCSIRFGFRTPPGERGADILTEIWGDPAGATLTPGFHGPSLPPAPDRAPATDLAVELGIEVGDPVDFWTEAALFADAGFDALVFGPGSIEQAHTADEWVALDQLAAAFDAYQRWLSSD